MAAPISLDVFSEKPKATKTAEVIFGGDMQFDRYMRQVSNTVGQDYLFSCIDPILLGADLTVANLEGPITNNPSVSVGTKVDMSDNFRFTFPPETAATLKRHNIGIVNIGNNHILNFGAAGYASTKAHLRDAGVQYFDQSLVATTTIAGIAVAFINFNEFSTEGGDIVESVRMLRSDGYIPVIYAHWGEEYETTASAYSHELAHRLIDGGAEIVIGSHPHVIEEHEVYQGKHIYYSLGNFIFDQYFSDAVRRGLLIRVHFSDSGVFGIDEIPIVLTRDGRTCLATTGRAS